MKKIGITGGIGSGKSTVCKIFETLGVPVFYADEAGKLLLNQNSDLITSVKKQFGEAMYKGRVLDRKKLASIVFSNPEKLNLLNSLVHPEVAKYFDDWLKKQTAPYIIKEAAILFESNAHKTLDAVIFVKAPESVRIQRVMDRDGVSKETVLQRINKQWPDAEKEKLSQFAIDNSGTEELIPQVIKLHQMLIA